MILTGDVSSGLRPRSGAFRRSGGRARACRTGAEAGQGFVGVAVLAAALALVRHPIRDAQGTPGSPEAAIFYYPWYSTPARDGRWAHWYVERGRHSRALDAVLPGARPLLVLEREDRRGADARDRRRRHRHRDRLAGGAEARPRTCGSALVTAAARRHGSRSRSTSSLYRGRTPATTAEDIERSSRTGFTDFYVYDADRDPPRTGRRHSSRSTECGSSGTRRSSAERRRQGSTACTRTTSSRGTAPRSAAICTQARRAGPALRAVGRPGLRRAPRDARRARAATAPRRDTTACGRPRSERGADIVTITSYNEWHEGTQIEPARASRRPATRGVGAARRRGADARTSTRPRVGSSALRARRASVERSREPAAVRDRQRVVVAEPLEQRHRDARAAGPAPRRSASGTASRISSSARSTSPASSAATTSGSSPLRTQLLDEPVERGVARAARRGTPTPSGRARADELGDARGRRGTPSPPGCPERRSVAASAWVRVDVDLHELDRAVAALRSRLLEHRRERVARAAPVGPEVDHDGHVS